MPSDRRLHPLSILFSLGALLRSFALPGGVVVVTASSRDWGSGFLGWELWGWGLWILFFLVPNALVATGRYLTFRYRFEPHELVIRSGFLFRNERNIPYGRIQNLDAVQNVFHRWFDVVTVRVDTGGGQEPEAKMSVLPLAAFEEMRGIVRAGRGEAQVESIDAAPAGPAGRVLLRLTPRDLLLHGLIENRGFVILAAAFGVLWELNVIDGLMGWIWEDQELSRGAVRDLYRSVTGGTGLLMEHMLRRAALALAAFAVFLLAVRAASMTWALLRLHGFRLVLVGEDLRTEFGLFTRVVATIPLRRIQTVTVREGLLARWLGRVAVRVETAGSDGGAEDKATQREWLAPILRRGELPGLLREVLPGLELADVAWNAAPPRAFRRELKKWILIALGITLGGVLLLQGWGLVLLPFLLAWAWIGARRTIDQLGWAVTGDTVLFRSGWLWRQISVAPFGKIQAVTLHESPFDRRAAMARVRVDTAGAKDLAHRVDIPYLERETARSLYGLLAVQAARTAFRW